MGLIASLFQNNIKSSGLSTARLMDGYAPIFTQFGRNIYASDVVQMCIDGIATECSKLTPQHVVVDDNGIPSPVLSDGFNRIFRFAPDPLMTTAEFIEKSIWLLYFNYNVFIYPIYTTQTDAQGIIDIKDVTEMRTALFASPEYRNSYIKRLQKRNLSETEQRALTTAAGSGGDAVPTATYDKIIAKLRQSSALFPLISDTYIPGNVKLPVANALNAAQWTAEATAVVSGDDTVTGVTLGGFVLAKFANISIAAMVMTVDAFETYIVDQIGMQLSIAVENAILMGQGPLAATPQPTGIIPGVTWDASNSATWAAGEELGYDDLVNQRALLNSVYRPFAKWVINRKMEAMIMKIKSTTGFPIFSQDPQNGFAPKILNVDYVLDEYMPGNTILFGCPNYYYMNFSQAPIIAASTEAGFATSTILYRGMLIADGKPALSEAFTRLTHAA